MVNCSPEGGVRCDGVDEDMRLGDRKFLACRLQIGVVKLRENSGSVGLGAFRMDAARSLPRGCGRGRIGLRSWPICQWQES